MCDTFVALSHATAGAGVIFAKNSNRDPNEAHQLVILPEAEHGSHDTVKCTYIEIPQVTKTYRTFLAKPFWIWGGEMGVNEYGVAIGNEAIFTKEKNNRQPGLIGMDYLRLGLERSTSAYQALEVITALLEKYGQSGNCGYSHPFFYQNSFLIADRHEAWILETIDHYWAAVKVDDVYSISNAYTIEEEWDIASSGLIPYARKQGWLKKGQDFNFKKCFSDFLFTKFSDAEKRRSTTLNMLERSRGHLKVQDAMSILRQHKTNWRPDRGVMGQDVCMHASFGPIRINQTVGSLVSVLNEPKELNWVTGTSAPCTSILKPVWLSAGLPDAGNMPGPEFDERQLWWRHEAVHRTLFTQYPDCMQKYMNGCLKLEEKFIHDVEIMDDISETQKKKITEQFFCEADEYNGRWRSEFEKMEPQSVMPFYNKYWQKQNTQVKL